MSKLNSSFQVVTQTCQDNEHLGKDSVTQPNDVDSASQVCMNDGDSCNTPILMTAVKHLFCFGATYG